MSQNRHHELVLKSFKGIITPKEQRELDLIQGWVANRPLDPLPMIEPIPYDCDFCDNDAVDGCVCGSRWCDSCRYEHECELASRRYNPFLDETIDPQALSFDPEATFQTGVLSFDPYDAQTHIFAAERADELATEDLLQTLQENISFSQLGYAVAYSWGMPGIGAMMSRKLRKALLSNPDVKEAAQQFAEVWLKAANKLL